MIIKLKITDKKNKPFMSDNSNEEIDYYWYRGLREDDVTISFGSINQKYNVGDEVEVDLEKFENRNGKISYKEII